MNSQFVKSQSRVDGNFTICVDPNVANTKDFHQRDGVLEGFRDGGYSDASFEVIEVVSLEHLEGGIWAPAIAQSTVAYTCELSWVVFEPNGTGVLVGIDVYEPCRMPCGTFSCPCSIAESVAV